MPVAKSMCAVFLGLALLCASSFVARAAEVKGLYEGQVPVTGKAQEERDAALAAALRQVIAKLTGIANPGVANPGADAVAQAMAAPDTYLQQFRYRDTPAADTPLALWARFDRAAVDALLRGAGLPLWSGQRPGVLAWVSVLAAEGVEIAAPDGGSGVAEALAERAWQRGLPLSFPLLDLEDRVRVQAQDLWSMDAAALLEASARYAPAVILVGRVEPTGSGAWVANWRLRESGGESTWVTRGLSAGAGAAGAMDVVADRLAARYAVSAQAPAQGMLQVDVVGVRNLGDYARTMGYLEGLDQVAGLRLSAARMDLLSLRMQVLGGAEGLRRVTAFGGVLSEIPGVGESGALRFRLLP